MKPSILYTSLVLLPIALIGCGGGEGGSAGSNDTVNFTTITILNDGNARRTNVTLNDKNARDTSYTINVKSRGSSNKGIAYNNYAGSNFFARQHPNSIISRSENISKSLDVTSNDKFSYAISSKNNGVKLTFTNTLATINIANTTVSTRSISTALADFKLINSTFPNNSNCYVYKSITPSFAVFKFSDGDTTNVSSVQNWLDTKNKEYNNPGDSSIVKVGENNDIEAAYIKVSSNKGYPAVVKYAGKYYNARYITAVSNNADPNQGHVDCTMYNKTAADYLESQIKLYGSTK